MPIGIWDLIIGAVVLVVMLGLWWLVVGTPPRLPATPSCSVLRADPLAALYQNQARSYRGLK